MSQIVRIGRVGKSAVPVAPAEIQDEVELYAREHGRTAHLYFTPSGWMVRFELRPNDPAMLAFKEGRAPEPPTEDVFIHTNNPKASLPGQPMFIPLDINAMGAAGVREFLEQGNTWSKRGVFSSHEESLKSAETKNEATKKSIKERGRDAARARARDTRRSRLKIPFLPVGADLKDNTNEGASK